MLSKKFKFLAKQIQKPNERKREEKEKCICFVVIIRAYR